MRDDLPMNDDDKESKESSGLDETEKSQEEETESSELDDDGRSKIEDSNLRIEDSEMDEDSKDIDLQPSSFKNPSSTFHRLSSNNPNEYYLEVVKEGEVPQWPKPIEELEIFEADLGDGWIQHWAYPEGSGKTAADLPEAEILARKYPTEKPSILIDQTEKLELILVKDSHALAKTESSLANLEDNLTSVIDLAKNKFNLQIEHFLTTDRVSDAVESKLNELEGGEEEIGLDDRKSKMEDGNLMMEDRKIDKNIDPQSSTFNDQPSTVNRPQSNNIPTSGIYASRPEDGPKSSKLALIIPVVLILAVFGGAIYFRSEIMAKIKQFNAPKEVPKTALELTPTATPTPTPIPVERGQYKIRILNGTTTSGAAGKLSEKLKELGWLIDRTGNNSDQNVEESSVKARIGTPDFVIEGLQKDVTDYTIASSSAVLKTTDKADLEIVIGKK